MKTTANLDLALKAISGHFGAGSIQRLGQNQNLDVDTLSTGSLAIDLAIGAGGLPRGRIVEIYGPEGSGKTTFCLSVIAEAQRRGGTGALIDVEHALDPAWARRCGVDTEQLVVSQPDCGEDALTIAEMLIGSNDVDIVVVDSVAALVPRSELEGQMGDATVGAQARLMSQAMRRLTAAIAKSKSILLFTNQIREKIGVIFGSPEYQPGGRALKFFASVRMDIRRKDIIKTAQGTILGHKTKVKVVKNKIAPPFGETEVDILFTEGISRTASLVDLGVERGLLEKSGAHLSFRGQPLGQGRETAKAFLASHPEVAAEIESQIRERALSPTVTALYTPDDEAA